MRHPWVRDQIIKPMRRSLPKGDRGYESFEDNDLAVEWCENRLLGEAPQVTAAYPSLVTFQFFKGGPADLLQHLKAVTRMQMSHTYCAIISAGQAGDGQVFLIKSGQVSVRPYLSPITIRSS